jgi:hypothetical protein
MVVAWPNARVADVSTLAIWIIIRWWYGKRLLSASQGPRSMHDRGREGPNKRKTGNDHDGLLQSRGALLIGAILL